MPWTVDDVDRHNKGLTKKQKKVWVDVANSALKRCLEKGGSEDRCEASAIRQANSVVKKMKKGGVMRASINAQMRILASDDPILERVVAGNPVLKAIRDTANGKIAVMDALSIGQEGYPSTPDDQKDIFGDGPWVFDREVAQRALPTFFGKPVIVAEGMTGHDGDRHTIGSIIGAEIYKDDRGEFVRVFPVLWNTEYPEIIEDIKANKDGLSTSFEIEMPQNSIELHGSVVKPKEFAFSGSCIVKRDVAAYPAQNINAVAHSSEATKEKSFSEISRMLWETIAIDDMKAYPVETFPSSVIYYKDNKYFKASYEIEDDKVTLGKPIEVKPTFIYANKKLPKSLSKLRRHAKILGLGDYVSDAYSPDMGIRFNDRKLNIIKKGGVREMLKIEEIPEEYQDGVSELIDAEVAKVRTEGEKAMADVKAEFEKKMAEDKKTGDDKVIELSNKLGDLTARIEATAKADEQFEKIKANYPENKHKEIRDILIKAELKTATTDDILKLSTEVKSQRTLNMGGGNGPDKEAIANKYGFQIRKQVITSA